VTTTCSSQDFNSATWSARESSSTHESGQKHEHVSISSPCSDAPDSLTEDIIKKVRTLLACLRSLPLLSTVCIEASMQSCCPKVQRQAAG
jgi:hypothetical protein